MSKLDGFLLEIDRNAIYARAKEATEPGLRLATAISLLALEQSGRFTRGLFTSLQQTPGASSTSSRGATHFDAAAFETAAFIHYALLAEHLKPPNGGDIDKDDDLDEADPHFVAVRDAHHLSGKILSSLLSFSVNEKIFLNRPIAYSMRSGRRGLVQMFEGVLIEAVENGAPATLCSTGIILNLSVPVVALCARSFAITTLPALEEVARNVVAHASELGFE
jgi:hypothetical protein